MAETLHRDGKGVLCFDGEHRVLFLSGMVEDLAQNLFRCRPQAGEPLPETIRDCVARLSEKARAEMPPDEPPLVLRQPDGSSVSLKLTLDPERNNHCLLFERELHFSSPEQLSALGLTRRETEVAYWILQVKTNWEIGKILRISSRTVDKHVERIFRKLGVNNRHHILGRARELCR